MIWHRWFEHGLRDTVHEFGLHIFGHLFGGWLDGVECCAELSPCVRYSHATQWV